MKDKDKTKEQLTNELEETRQRIKRLEKAQQSLEIFEAAIDGSSDLIMICNTGYKILKVSAGLASTLNVKPGDLVGKVCYEVIHTTNVPHPQCPHQEAMKTKKIARAELFEPNLGLYLDISVSPLLGQEGQIRGAIHTFKDITERKQAEEELRNYRQHLEELVKERTEELQNTREELERIFNLSVDIIAVADLKTGFFTKINPAFSRIIGYSSKESKSASIKVSTKKSSLAS